MWDKPSQLVTTYHASSFSLFTKDAIEGELISSERSSRKVVKRGTGEYEDFYKTETFEEACDLALYGWKEGRESLLQVKKGIELQSKEQAIRIYDDICGVIPNVAAYLSGNPLSMINLKCPHEIPTLNIGYCGGVHCGIDADTVIARGAAITSLIDELENNGVSCQLTYLDISKYNGQEMKVSFVLKRFGEFFDVDEVAFALGHPSTQRRFIFSLNEQTPFKNEAEEITQDNYGAAWDWNPEDEDYDIVIPRIKRNGDDPNCWLEELTQQFTNQKLL